MKALSVLLAIFVSGVHAHPGGLNSEGCHNNRRTGDYHCHGGSPSRSGSTQRSAAPAKAPPPSSGGPTCYIGPRGGTYTITRSGKKNYSGC